MSTTTPNFSGEVRSALLGDLDATETNVEDPEPLEDPPEKKRLACLDVVRGITVCLMVFVDDAGDCWQKIDHSPWNGITLADTVMPFFLVARPRLVRSGRGATAAADRPRSDDASLIVRSTQKQTQVMVGAALALSRPPPPQRIAVRTCKLFLLGVALQGGGFPDATNGTWGYDLSRIRWCGILQRIAFAYAVASATLAAAPPRGIAPGSAFDALKAHARLWVVVAAWAVAYAALTCLGRAAMKRYVSSVGATGKVLCRGAAVADGSRPRRGVPRGYSAGRDSCASPVGALLRRNDARRRDRPRMGSRRRRGWD